MDISTDIGRHENDLCETAVEVDFDPDIESCTHSTTFHLVGSVHEPDIPRCESFYVDVSSGGDLEQFSRFFYSGHSQESDFFGGIWFKVEGQEFPVGFEASLEAGGDTIYFAFYSGSCGSLVCEKLNLIRAGCFWAGVGFDGCAIFDAYFDAAPGKIYYVYVGGLSLESITEDKIYSVNFVKSDRTPAPTIDSIGI